MVKASIYLQANYNLELFLYIDICEETVETSLTIPSGIRMQQGWYRDFKPRPFFLEGRGFYILINDWRVEKWKFYRI
ncbi:hypothetical protein D8M04_00615 [Oceanobacillus piezotolerans]|uniref:Uncharacterized protein n=1 Tax=Oceanobacillus piezotolerans TaxID=2448030 RepID=A0A498DS53_9BACI|nr:hypothetical protein D8M04_00615 [Oceanobacillus piezotolerans]